MARLTALALPGARRTASLTCFAILMAVLPPRVEAQIAGLEGRAVPRQSYLFAFEPFRQGRYGDARRAFNSAASSGINTGVGRWIDSICYYTMLGECQYHLGDLRGALKQYDSALELMIARRGWLSRIRLQQQIQAVPLARAVPWGPSSRNLMIGNFPETMLSHQGTDVNQALRQGGTVQAQELYPVRVIEIMRCVALSLRRRNELLGPVAAEMQLTNQLIKELSRRQVPPNHWMQTLINVQLAIAKSAANRDDEALRLLQQSLAVGGRVDHPLTSIALLELGDLAAKAGKLEAAQQMYFEATFPAANYGQATVLAEAFDGAARVHSMRGGQGIFAPLANARTWCQANRLDVAATVALLASAENAAYSGNAKLATQLGQQVRRSMGRSDMPRSELGVRLQYVNAAAAFQNNRIDSGRKLLQESSTLGKLHSRRLLQLEITTRLHGTGDLSALVANRLYERLLREPNASDWMTKTRDTLLFEMTPHVVELERWLDMAIERGETEMVVLIGDMIRRHKFYSQLPLAGRMLAMRWLLAAPGKAMDAGINGKQALISRLPNWEEAVEQLEQATTKLTRIPVEGDNKVSPLTAPAQQIVTAAEAQENMLWSIALAPVATERVFPPLRTQDEILAKLKPGQAILVLTKRGRVTHAILLASGNQYRQWQIPGSRLRSQLLALMREIGNVDSKRVLVADRLGNDKWKQMAATVFEPFAKELTAKTLAGLDELIIVPDGEYWYFPFEMVPINDGDSQKLLTDLVKVRYVPTVGLAVGDDRPAQTGPRTIVHGRLYNRETEEITTEVAASLKSQQPRSYILRKRLPAASRFLVPTWRELIVLDDIEELEKGPLDWSVAQFDRGKPGSTLGDWLQMPWGGPEVVVLPGFHTAAESGLRGKQRGDEMLVATSALLATGTRTALLSRWRSGGQISMEIVREFCSGLADSNGSTSFQRSMALARSTELDPSVEPRLKNVNVNAPPSAEHPFFWASYMLIGK